MPKEEEMLAKDKYTIFDRKEKRYRKGLHSMCCALEEMLMLERGGQDANGDAELPKWTRVSQRLNPPGF